MIMLIKVEHRPGWARVAAPPRTRRPPAHARTGRARRPPRRWRRRGSRSRACASTRSRRWSRGGRIPARSAVLDSATPRSGLTVESSSIGYVGGLCGSAAREVLADDRVGEERAAAHRVRIVRVEHHPLAAPRPSTACARRRSARAPTSTPRADASCCTAPPSRPDAGPARPRARSPAARAQRRRAVAELELSGGHPHDPSSGSSSSTDTSVSDSSCPYAPMFWIGAAPAEPGMPLSASIPASPSATARSTTASHGSPACAQRPSNPRERDPQHDAVEAVVGDQEVGPPADDEQRVPGVPDPVAASMIDSRLSATSRSRGGPPTRIVVRSASRAITPR